MRFSVLTLFPELINRVIATGITGKALEKEIFELETIQIRDFAVNTYGKVDDYLYGGGTGMLLMAQPIFAAWQEAVGDFDNLTESGQEQKSNDPTGATEHKSRTILLTPKGKPFDQRTAVSLSRHEHLVLICGHYEGIDQRVIDEIVDDEISVGDYVLTGGEIAACVLIDAVARLLEDVLPNTEAYTDESFMQTLLEQRHFTRPAIWQNISVPDVLLSGHQAEIKKWRKTDSLWETLTKRPDLLSKTTLTYEDWLQLVLSYQDHQKNTC